MKVAADTNVLVRFLTRDDPVQSGRAAAVLTEAAGLFIPSLVLCETVWVLRQSYKLPTAEILRALRDLIDSAGVEVDHPAAEAGLRMLAAGGDFADGVILHEAQRAKADKLVTFDSGFAARGGGFVQDLKLPPSPA
ncbi:type II toxin-antitoxin system VapC family toxin [Elstera cyanobacteriorum]|uniref:type II toxin-antitoxin system VapC family toxin n=1 Tax=Elstera cyanobacteriorum TaxID=2022747 RepID=UPI002357732C|nr:type II toxin-antitoxin system VapC family toxin [Elstera cyanobacteriorum]MCK6444379.1 type II toxin-antitoxin system VapC family toxin [Elstera cyanobacteriorum]